MNDDKWLEGLKFARQLNYSEAQYEEALRRIDAQPDLNKLLDALVDVKDCNNKLDNSSTSIGQESLTQTGAGKLSTSSCSSSCYSSITSFPLSSSSSDLSLIEPSAQQQQPISSLRKVYIDGPNVAKTHGNGGFSWIGIKLCVDWFLKYQHPVKVIVPEERCVHVDEKTLHSLDGILETTPTGCNDDWFVIRAAQMNNGIIVSNDQFRDEKRFNVDLQRFIQLNRLPYAFIGDLFIPAEDPRGSLGPTLIEFLKESPSNQWNFSNNTSNQYQNKLYRTKSHQRYQRTGYHMRTQINHFQQHHQPNFLKPTLSLPVGHSTNISHNQQILVTDQGKQNSARQHTQLRRTISAAYSNNMDSDSHCQTQVSQRNTKALCRTKSHNI